MRHISNESPSANPEQLVPRPFDELEQRLAFYETSGEAFPGASAYDPYMTPDEIVILKHHLRDHSIFELLLPELQKGNIRILPDFDYDKALEDLFEDDVIIDIDTTEYDLGVEMGYMLARITYSMPHDVWPDYFGFGATDVALEVQELYRKAECGELNWEKIPTQEMVEKRLAIAQLAQQLGKLVDRAGSITVGAALDSTEIR